MPPGDWVPGGFPLGTWLRNQRTNCQAGMLAPERVRELRKLGVVWSHQDHAFEEGLVAARNWAAEHGHFLPPAAAVWDGYPVGTWAKNLRTAARLADARGTVGGRAPPTARSWTGCRRSGGTRWMRSIRAGRRSGMPDGSAACASCRTA
ncbi:helicase associated domain-containing protein [Streptomyces kanamyceticus]|uniref:helicase associated domain-containing protein n=1 Tax=Streptomyces kanamyceticus TaxID=1967 RepID=UPI0012FF38E4